MKVVGIISLSGRINENLETLSSECPHLTEVLKGYDDNNVLPPNTQLCVLCNFVLKIEHMSGRNVTIVIYHYLD